MRIALLPSAYAPAVGGVEELTSRLAHHLVASGHEVEVWVNRHPADLPARELIDGITVRRFELYLPASSRDSLARAPRATFEAVRSMGRAMRAFKPDVVHVQCFSVNGVYATLMSWLFGTPLVVSLQGETVMDDNDIYEKSVSLQLGLRVGLRRARAVTGCSQFVLDDAERFGLRLGAGVVVPNGVDLEESADPVPLDLPFERFVLAMGRVVTKKGFDLLIDAFALIADEHPELGLVIGGDGPARQGLLEQVARLGLEGRTVLPGRLTRGHVAWATRHAALFALPSRVEPFGIVVLEAMRAGAPLVVSSHGGAQDIARDGIEALVADPFDATKFAAAIERVLYEPEGTLERIAAAAPRVRGYGWPEITRRYLELYPPAA